MSTDSDPPTDNEQVRELVRDELANALSEADIDLDDLPQKSGTTRRDVLKAAGLAGAAGLTGAAGMNSAAEPASAGTQSTGTIGTTANPVDIEAEDISAAAIDTDSISLEEITSAPTGAISMDSNGNLYLRTHSGTQGTVYIGDQDSGDMRGLIHQGSSALGGSRWIGGHVDSVYGGLPGMEIMDFGLPNVGVYLRPPDQGIAGITYDRSDGSKEWAIQARSGQYEGSNQDAPINIYRDLQLDGSNIRNQGLAEHGGRGHGRFRFEDDFLGGLDPRWTQTGAAGTSMQSAITTGSETAGGGAVQIQSNNNGLELDFGGQLPFHSSHERRLAVVFEPRDDTQVELDIGFRQDANNSELLRVDAGASAANFVAETASGGVSTTTDSLEDLNANYLYIAEVVGDPAAGEVRFNLHDRGPNFHPRRDQLTTVATHTTNLPSGGLDPYLRWTATEAVNKELLVDFVWCEGDRAP